MWCRPVVTILMLIIAVTLTLSVRAQQKPFTEEQVSNLVRAGLGEESGAKLIEQRGIDLAPAEDFLQSLEAAGGSEAFLMALRAAKPPEPSSAKMPLNQVQVFVLLAGQVSSSPALRLFRHAHILAARRAGSLDSRTAIRQSESCGIRFSTSKSCS